MNWKRNSIGFTLIELLIVVAIIAILAAIAIPNFLQAQTRSKTSRCMADIKTCSNAMELYKLDWDFVPYLGDQRAGLGTGEYLRWLDFSGEEHGIGRVLTHPVAYLTSVPVDVFNSKVHNTQGTGHSLSDVVRASFFYRGTSPKCLSCFYYGFGTKWDRNFRGKTYTYLLQTVGPDLVAWAPGREPFYDPTNGTISVGDIWYFDTAGFLPERLN